jgi:hypothetical protein
VEILDVRDPSQPRQVAYYDLGGITMPLVVYPVGNMLYVGSYDAGLVVLEYTGPGRLGARPSWSLYR